MLPTKLSLLFHPRSLFRLPRLVRLHKLLDLFDLFLNRLFDAFDSVFGGFGRGPRGVLGLFSAEGDVLSTLRSRGAGLSVVVEKHRVESMNEITISCLAVRGRGTLPTSPSTSLILSAKPSAFSGSVSLRPKREESLDISDRDTRLRDQRRRCVEDSRDR